MPTYSKGDFSKANAANSILNQDGVDANNVKVSITNFVEGSIDSLKGPAWDYARNNINEYNSVLSLRKQYAQEIVSTISKVNSAIIAALDGEDSINTDLLEDQKAIVQKLKNEASKLKNSTSSTTTSSTNNSKQLTADDYQSLIYEAELMVQKIENVKNAVSSALGELQGLNGQISDYNNKVNNLIPSSIIFTEKI